MSRRSGRRLHKARSSKDRRRKKEVAYLRTDGKCAYCGGAFSLSRLTIDHIVPLSKGGSWRNENITVACDSCNQAKGNKLYQ